MYDIFPCDRSPRRVRVETWMMAAASASVIIFGADMSEPQASSKQAIDQRLGVIKNDGVDNPFVGECIRHNPGNLPFRPDLFSSSRN